MSIPTLYIYDRTNAQWVPLNPIPYAHSVVTTTTNFGGILSGTDATVQAALDTIDDHNHDSIYLNVARTDAYTPTANYHPATKKYVDDAISAIDLSPYLRKDGTVALTANWDAGPFKITAETFESDVAIGTAPFTVTSTTVVPNLNVDQVDGYDLNQGVQTTDSPSFVQLTLSQADGTTPMNITSTTLVSNLNADLLDGQEGSYYLDLTNATNQDQIDHGSISGLTDDDHTQYFLADCTRYIPNNTFILGRNNADGANINILKVNASDAIEIGANIKLGTYSLGDGTGTLAFDGSGNLTASDYVKADSFWAMEERTNTSYNKYIAFMRDSGGLELLRYQTAYWSGAAWIDTDGCGFGLCALDDSVGSRCNGFGYNAMRYNIGNYGNGYGAYALYRNTGSFCNAFGYWPLWRNRGDYANGIGYRPLEFSIGDGCNGFGSYTLRYGDLDNNTAIGEGAFSTFNDDAANAVTFDDSDVDVANDRVTVTAHGLGAVGTIRNLRFTAAGAGVPGLDDGGIDQWEVIDANTLECLTDTITGTGSDNGHTLTPQYQYTNSTAVGANSEPDASNQVFLGGSSVTQVKTYGEVYGIAGGHFGGTTNYTEHDSAGYQTMAGTARVWRSRELKHNDVDVPAANFPAEDDIDGFKVYRFDDGTEEYLYYTFELPGNYCDGGTVQVGFKLMVENPPTVGDGDKVVVMGCEYKLIQEGDVFDFSADTSSGTVSETIAGGETAFERHTTGKITLSGLSSPVKGDTILMRLYRDATNVADTFDFNGATGDDDVWVYATGVRWVSDSLGGQTS